MMPNSAQIYLAKLFINGYGVEILPCRTFDQVKQGLGYLFYCKMIHGCSKEVFWGLAWSYLMLVKGKISTLPTRDDGMSELCPDHK